MEVRIVKMDWNFLIMEKMGCHCILELDIMKFTCTQVNFPIAFDNLSENLDLQVYENITTNWKNNTLSDADRKDSQNIINEFKTLSSGLPSLTHVISHIIDTGIIRQSSRIIADTIN